jgi:hypothetical protein
MIKRSSKDPKTFQNHTSKSPNIVQKIIEKRKSKNPKKEILDSSGRNMGA